MNHGRRVGHARKYKGALRTKAPRVRYLSPAEVLRLQACVGAYQLGVTPKRCPNPFTEPSRIQRLARLLAGDNLTQTW